MLALPQEYLGSACEIKTLTNRMLAKGYLLKIDHEALEIAARKDEFMPLIPFRTVVKIVVRNSELQIKTLAGIAYLSTENFARIEEIKILNEFERRKAFRVPIDVPAKIYPVLEDEEQRDFDAKILEMDADDALNFIETTAIHAKALDVSLSGVQILPNDAENKLEKGKKYIVEFTPLRRPMRFNMTVQRIFTNYDGKVHYGCQFYGERERQVDILCKELFELQRAEIRRSTKDNY